MPKDSQPDNKHARMEKCNHQTPYNSRKYEPQSKQKKTFS